MIPDKLWRAAQSLDEFLRSCHFTYCLIGGIAIQRWGEPRMTQDVDASVFVEIGAEMAMITSLLARYEGRIPDVADFAVQARVVLLRDRTGCPLGVAFAGLEFEQRMFERATDWRPTGKGRIRTCSAEDLVVLKAFANRPQDWIDIERVIIRQHHRLDRQLILTELTPLVELKEEPQILHDLQHLFSA